MRFLTYRGTRIRRYHLHVLIYLKLILALPLMVMAGVYAYYLYIQELYLNYVYYIPLLLVAIIAYPVVLFLYYFMEDRSLFYKKWCRKWLVAHHLDQHGYVLEKKREGTRTKKYFPKVYLKQGQYDLILYLGLEGSKFQERFLKIGGEFETTFFMDYMDKTNEEKYIAFRYAYSAFLNRIKVKDVELNDKYELKLSENIYWEMKENPHLLIAGGTGAGKTVFMRSLLKGLAKKGVVYLADPKRADFVPLADLPVFKGRVFYETADIVGLVNRIKFINDNRYDEMRRLMAERKEHEMGAFDKYGLPPVFLIVDEFNAFMSTLDWKLREQLESDLTQILLKGRQSGVYVVLAMQRPSADDLPLKFRSNMMHHISLGRLDDNAYIMMFGEENKDKEFRYIERLNGKRIYGRGYSAVFGKQAQEFYAPLLTKDVDFYEILKEYERIENPFDPIELEEKEEKVEEKKSEEVELIVSIAEKTYTQQEVADILAEKDLTVTRANIRTIFNLMKELGYIFDDDESPSIKEGELRFIEEVVQEKEESDLSYKEIVIAKV